MMTRRSGRSSGLVLIGEHHRRVPLNPRQLRPLHRRVPEGRAERLLVQREDVARQRPVSFPAMNSRALNGESSASACENVTFHGHTLWEMCRFNRFEIALTTGNRTVHLVSMDARRYPHPSAQIGRTSVFRPHMRQIRTESAAV